MIVKNLLTREKALPKRTVLVVLLILMFAFGKYLSASASICLLYAMLFPWAICQAHSMHLNGEYTKDSTLKWVCASLAVYVLSALLTMSVEQDWALQAGTFFVVSLFILYVPANMSIQEIRKNLFGIGCMMVCLYLPFVLIALFSVFTGRTIRIPGFNGYIGIQVPGNVGERIRIFCNTNITARYLAFNILFCLYAICVKKDRRLRAFCFACILINFVGLTHTQSRTGLIALAAALGTCAFRFVYLRLKKRGWRLLAAGAVCIVIAAVVLEGANLINKTDIRIAQKLYAQSTQTLETAEEGTALTTRVAQQGQFDVYSSGRGDIWPPTIQYMLDHPEKLLLGLGQGNVMEEIGQEHPQILSYAHLHNSFLSCAVRCGVPFLICILGFLCTLVRPAWRMLLQTEDETNRGMFIIPVFIVMLLLMGITEEVLFISTSYGNLLFYLMCGFVLRFKHLEKRNTNEN